LEPDIGAAAYAAGEISNGPAIFFEKIKGYDHFETTTGSHGTFRFTKLFPNSAYRIIASKEEWAEGIKTIGIGPEGTIALLESPICLRYKLTKEGIITDTRTGLQWAPDPGGNKTCYQAKEYADNLTLGGYSDWRLPTRAELRGLYEPNKTVKALERDYNVHIDPVFKLSGIWVWSSESAGSSGAWDFNFSYGREGWDDRDFSHYRRVLSVRSRR
ncbi:MAG: DUF1566 domain-containing protein, partial [bacterium]|nr:DUF1566 domain-containing protein [bacterium]